MEYAVSSFSGDGEKPLIKTNLIDSETVRKPMVWLILLHFQGQCHRLKCKIKQNSLITGDSIVSGTGEPWLMGHFVTALWRLSHARYKYTVVFFCLSFI